MPWTAIINLANDFVIAILIITTIILSRLYFSYKTKANNIRTMKNEELKLFHEVLSNKEIQDREFLIEQLMELKYGHAISWREIKYLMELPSPSEALSCFMDAKLCVAFPFKNSKPAYIGWFKNKNYRCFRKQVDLIGYFTSSIGSVALFYLAFKIMLPVNMEAGLAIIILAFVLIITAFFALKGYLVFLKAERFMGLIDYSEKETTQGKSEQAHQHLKEK